jgi:urease accessory protein
VIAPPLLRLLQLASPALPIGAFAYSQGLEHAVTAGWVSDEASARAWIGGLLEEALARLEVPVLGRLERAFVAENEAEAERWNDFLLASRGSAELRAEEQRLGSALARLLVTLEVAGAERWAGAAAVSHLAMFALAAARWQIPASSAAGGYLFSWAENQVGAACRLVPLGQSAAQRILSFAGAAIPAAVARGLGLADDEIGFSAPGQSIGAALHETQYSRIFRS